MSQDQVESEFAMSGKRSSITIDGIRLSVMTALTDDSVDIDFVQSTEPTPEPTAQIGRDLPEEGADAVPDDAFEFSYREDQGVVRVNFVKAVDADEVTVRAVEADSEASTTTPGVVSSLTVYVASSGGEVAVTATVDGVSGEVAREEIP
jgi:hypothetical protein